MATSSRSSLTTTVSRTVQFSLVQSSLKIRSLFPQHVMSLTLSFIDSTGEDRHSQLGEPGMPECWSVAPSTLRWGVMLCLIQCVCGQTQMLFSLSRAVSADECIWKVIVTPI
jgi:hypothetical protein